MQLVYRSRGLLAAALLSAQLGCPKTTGNVDSPKPPLPGSSLEQAAPLALEPIPTKLTLENIPPMSGHEPSARSPLLDVMMSEVTRSMESLRRQPIPAYYVSYQIHDLRQVIIEAEGGALITYSDESERFLDTAVRVGAPQLDNTRQLSNAEQNAFNAPMFRKSVMPFGNDESAIRHHLWLDTDRRYREAALALRVVMTDQSVTAQGETPPDFVLQEPQTYIEPIAALEFSKEEWVERAQECSKRALKGVATRGACRLDFMLHTTYFVNSEGTVLQMSQPRAQLSVSVGVKADDGMPLGRLEQRFARTPAGLPGEAQIDEMIRQATTDLNALHKAPVVDPYAGPAILEGRAAAVFFHEVFGHRIEGHRQKERISGQTFASKVDEQIMPAWLNVYDDPTISRLNQVDLSGFYRFDDEGVKAERAVLVDKGVLKGFVMGRNPIKSFPSSNGHGRKEPGNFAVSRQGNLVVEASRTMPAAELEKALIEEVKRQGKPFGMVFTDISGGFTNTTRFLPQAFKVEPVMAYRLYPDGRRELVRGVDIVGTPLIALSSIMAASREVQTFNGICGAESGWVPVSASAPSMLLQSLEVERGFSGVDRPPVLPPPSIDPANPNPSIQSTGR